MSKVSIQAVPGVPSRLRLVSRVGSYAAILVGILALVGWLLDIPALKSVFPGLTPMKPLTAWRSF